MENFNYIDQLPGCSSGPSKKRKQPDSEDILHKEGPLTEPPIENEYENLEEDDDEDGVDGNEDFSNIMRRADYEQIQLAQEKATIKQYDDIKVTPFNLEEELEEGKFDKSGNFIFKKRSERDSEEEDDNWAESVDWAEVEKKEKELVQSKPATDQQITASTNNSESALAKLDKLGCYKRMLRLMKSDETVKKTIQRLGNCIPKRKPVNRNSAKFKKNQEEDASASNPDSIANARQVLDLMIDLAHQRLEDGDMNIYEKSYEDLEDAIN